MRSVTDVLSILKTFSKSLTEAMMEQTKAVQAANTMKREEMLKKAEEIEKPGEWREVKNPKPSEVYPLVEYEKKPSKPNKLWTF